MGKYDEAAKLFKSGYGALSNLIERFDKLKKPSGELPYMPRPENAAKTQRENTFPTYVKAKSILDAEVGESPTLDFGAGKGLSQGLGFDTYEPFPMRKGFNPTFTSPKEIADNSYKRLTNLYVLNVVPREIRDTIVKDIGRVLSPDGTAVITTRGKEVLDAKGSLGPENMSIITSADTYQKGFTKKELQNYLQETLGDNFEVTPIKLGEVGAKVKKLSTSKEID